MESKQLIYDTWLTNSNITVDRRNGRDQVLMKKDEFDKRYIELVAKDIEIKETTDKFGIKRMKAPQYIATATVREIKRKLNDKFSRGTICNYRPFFVGVATEREKLECLCKTYLNPRLLHNALMKEVKAKMECVQTATSLSSS